MKVLYCNRDSICEPGIVWAFKSMGHELTFSERKVQNPETDTDYMAWIADYLHREGADMVFSVNFVPVISRVCQENRVPYFCWIVDSPVLQLYSDTLCNSCNYVFIFDYTLYAEFCDKNPGHIFYLPLGCDIEWFDNIKVTPEDHELYDCDVSFVGSLYTEKCSYNAIESKLPDYLQGYFKGALNAQRMIYGYNFLGELLTDEVVATLRQYVSINQCEGYQVDQKILFWILLNAKCTVMERVHLINAIAQRFSIDLYTGSDTASLVNVRCRGTATSLEGMPKVFKCSKINLNLTAKGIQSGASLRIYDVLGCGGFLISNYQAELPEQFEVGKEIVLFESEQDLLEKIDYYLKHEEERKQIAKNGYEKVKREYTYRKRMEYMFEIYDAIEMV